MILTFGEAKKAIAKYVGKSGKCPDSEEVGLFLKECIQQLLFRGANGNLRKWVFFTENGTFTAPSDLELPIKMKVGGEAAEVFDKFYEFYDSSTLDDCQSCEKGLQELPNTYFTQYDIPKGCFRILVVPQCCEDEDAHIIVSGVTREGKEIRMPHKSAEYDLNGEFINISKKSPKYSQSSFAKITAIQKTKTKGYVRIYAYNPETGERRMLADYKPLDTQPSFRRYKVHGANCDKCTKVTILGRIRFCDNYADNDVIPISNIRALKLMAQQLQAEDQDDVQVASYKNRRIEQALQNENFYKRTSQQVIDIFDETAPGSLCNLI